MEETKFEIDGHIEETEENFTEEESNGRGPGLYILLAVFIILFLTVASMFVYFQFYHGNGKWSFSLQKQVLDNELLNQLTVENKQLTKQIDSLQLIVSDTTYSEIVGSSLFGDEVAGEKYEVQIGFFRSFDFNRYNSGLVNMNVEVSNGASKLLIGRFNSFSDACAFRKDMVDMGIKGAFVVKKVNGNRVDFDGKCP